LVAQTAREHTDRPVEGPAGLAYFFRIAIRNKGNSAAEDVQVFLNKIDRLVDENPQIVSAFTPMNLLWAYLDQATLPILLPDMPPRYCNLFHVEQPYPSDIETSQRMPASLVLDIEYPSNTGGHILKAGTYLLGLILACSNGPSRRYTLKVNFPGRWHADENVMFNSGIEIISTHKKLWISVSQGN
jgi:hypothetical protein